MHRVVLGIVAVALGACGVLVGAPAEDPVVADAGAPRSDGGAAAADASASPLPVTGCPVRPAGRVIVRDAFDGPTIDGAWKVIGTRPSVENGSLHVSLPADVGRKDTGLQRDLDPATVGDEVVVEVALRVASSEINYTSLAFLNIASGSFARFLGVGAFDRRFLSRIFNASGVQIPLDASWHHLCVRADRKKGTTETWLDGTSLASESNLDGLAGADSRIVGLGFSALAADGTFGGLDAYYDDVVVTTSP